MLKIATGRNGRIETMQLSDNADLLLMNEVNEKFSSMDTTSLAAYFRAKGYIKAKLMMPVTFTINTCRAAAPELGSERYLYNFNHKKYTDKAVSLPELNYFLKFKTNH